jgi:hypothetical protein
MRPSGIVSVLNPFIESDLLYSGKKQTMSLRIEKLEKDVQLLRKTVDHMLAADGIRIQTPGPEWKEANLSQGSSGVAQQHIGYVSTNGFQREMIPNHGHYSPAFAGNYLLQGQEHQTTNYTPGSSGQNFIFHTELPDSQLGMS